MYVPQRSDAHGSLDDSAPFSGWPTGGQGVNVTRPHRGTPSAGAGFDRKSRVPEPVFVDRARRRNRVGFLGAFACA